MQKSQTSIVCSLEIKFFFSQIFFIQICSRPGFIFKMHLSRGYDFD